MKGQNDDNHRTPTAVSGPDHGQNRLPSVCLPAGHSVRAIRAAGKPAADYTALRRAGGYYTVTYGGQTYDTESPLMDIHRQLFEHASYDRSVLALHGAAVAWKGRAVALLAATGSGKNDLTAT